MIPQSQILHSIYKPRIRSEAIYYFENTVKNEETKGKPKHYSSKVKIRCVNVDKAHYYFQLEVLETTYQGSRVPKLLRKVNMAFDLVMIKINKKGKIVGVSNMKAIRKNWEKQKENLKEEYEGTAVFKLFRKIDDTLRTERKLIKALQHPKLYGLFFNGYWLQDESNLDPTTKLNIELLDDTAAIQVEQNDATNNYRVHYLYKNNKLIESSIIENNITYNALCLG